MQFGKTFKSMIAGAVLAGEGDGAAIKADLCALIGPEIGHCQFRQAHFASGRRMTLRIPAVFFDRRLAQRHTLSGINT